MDEKEAEPMMDDYPMMEGEPMMDAVPMMDNWKPPTIGGADDIEAPPLAGNQKHPKTVKSKFSPSIAVPQDEIIGDTEQMKVIKAYIQEQVQLRVNAAIDKEAERQIDLQMREFKEQTLREAANRLTTANSGN